MIVIDKANYMFCVFCGEDSKKIHFEEDKHLLVCTSCGKVISYLEINKAAIKTFKAMGGGKDFPTTLKEPLKVRVPLVLDRYVTYLHSTEKTWERVPMQLYARSIRIYNRNETYFTPILRIGNNTYEFDVANFGHCNKRKLQRKGHIRDRHIETRKVDRKKLLNADFGYDNDKWPSKPLLKKGDLDYGNEIKAWKELVKEEKASKKAWIKLKKRSKTKKEQKSYEKYKKRIKKEAKESEFIKVIAPFVRRSKSKAVNVYQALSNMKWSRISDGKEYSCSWRHAGGLVADIRKKNETYIDFYCSGDEGNVTEEFETYMKRKGWEKLPWE